MMFETIPIMVSLYLSGYTHPLGGGYYIHLTMQADEDIIAQTAEKVNCFS